MRFLPLVVCALLFQVPAKADKFWLSDPAAEKNAAEGSVANVVIGVLIAESDEGYHVRIAGGEVILPKASVFKIEKDDLSIDAIVKMENDAAKEREAADRERQMAQAAAQRDRAAKAVEATARRSAEAETSEAPAVEAVPEADAGFDPVIGTDVSPRSMNQTALQREVQLAWSLTKDRRYLKLLRQLRRLR